MQELIQSVVAYYHSIQSSLGMKTPCPYFGSCTSEGSALAVDPMEERQTPPHLTMCCGKEKARLHRRSANATQRRAVAQAPVQPTGWNLPLLPT